MDPELTPEQIQAVNELKTAYEQLSARVEEILGTYMDFDKRWQALGKTKLQESATWTIRAVTRRVA